MSDILNKLDIVTDLRRCVASSFSDEGFNDVNFIIFLNHAENNLQKIQKKIDKRIYSAVLTRLHKAKNAKNPIGKRREDLLTASSFLI